MSAIDRLRCRLGIHDWRSGICFSCGKKADSSGVGGSRKASASPARVPPARVDETQAPAGRAAPPLSPPPAAPLSASSTSNEAAASQWHVGELILDLYEVKEVFESGGMGLVYRVRHRGWNTDLAVKSPRVKHFRTAEQRRRFEAEIEAWIGLGLHPHIASCYYVRTLGGVPRVFAEYVAGGTLDTWIKNRRLYAGGREAAQERLLDVALQIAWGMGYAHTQGAGLVHQDLKPLNVLMSPEGTAKVTDFGLAQARGRAGATEAAADGRTVYVAGCGLLTPAYASPEQYAQGQGVALSRKTDIWSWAVTVLEMYLGGLPWEPKTPGHVALAHGLEGYLQSGAADPAIPPLPPVLQGLLRECLKPNPAERPADFGAVAARLRGIYRETAGRDYPRVPPVPAELQADALSNRAISMLDLGRESEALALFEQALAQEPGHPQATYNRGLVRWRRGEITDLELVQQLEQAQTDRPGSWLTPYLLGLVHLERRDAVGARAALTAAQGLADRPEIRSAVEMVRKVPASAGSCIATLEGHTKSVTSLGLSADGRWAVSGSHDDTVRLWDLSGKKCLSTLENRTDKVTGIWSLLEELKMKRPVALSADGRRALSGNWDRTLRLWNLDRGLPLRTLDGHTGRVESVALSADGRLALSGSADETLRLWDLDSGDCLLTLTGHASSVSAVALSADGRRGLSGSGDALSGSKDHTLRLWDLDSGQCIRTLKGHTDEVTSVALSLDGHRGLSGSDDQTLRLWDLTRGLCLRTLKGHTRRVLSVAMSADGRLALSGSLDRTLRLWNLDSGQCIRTLEGHTDRVAAVALSAGGHRALSGGWDWTLRLWDTEAWLDDTQALGGPLVVSEATDATALLAVQRQCRNLLSQADEAFLVGRWAEAWRLAGQAQSLPGYRFDLEVRLRAQRVGWRGGVRSGLRGAQCLKTLEGHTSLVESVALSSDGLHALSGGYDQTLRLWDLDHAQCRRTLKGDIQEGIFREVNSVALSGDGRRALSGYGETLRLWDLDSGVCLRTLNEHGNTGRMNAVALSADGRLALSGSADNTLRLWDLDRGLCLRTLEGHTLFVSSVALSADGRLALSGSADSTLRLWDLDCGQCLRTLVGHAGWVTSVALSSDGRRGVSGSNDQTLRLWDLQSGQCIRTLKEHSDRVTSVALSGDGRYGLSGSDDQTLRIWDLDRGQCVKILEGHTQGVTSVTLSADGRRALSGSHDQTLRLWELEWDYAFPEPKDWDEGARPYLRNFLALLAPQVAPGLPAKRGRPTWDGAAWEQFQNTLCDAGYGWLRPDGVRRELEKMAEQWPLVAGSLAHEQSPMTDRAPPALTRQSEFPHEEFRGLEEPNKEEDSRPGDSANAPFVRDGGKVGRNEPCPCGSGKKYKHCHGKAA